MSELNGLEDDLRSTLKLGAGSADQQAEAAIHNFIEHLLNPDHAESDSHLMAIGYELEALLSIYPSSVRMSATSRPASIINVKPPSEDASSAPMEPHRNSQWEDAVQDFDLGIRPNERIRYEVCIPVWEQGEVLEGLEADLMPEGPSPVMRILVSLPPTYPSSSSPPQLQLLGRYLGKFAIDAGLFGDVTRTYIVSSGVAFSPGDVCVFEGLTYTQELVKKWYAAHLSEKMEGEKLRDAERDRKQGKSGRGFSDLQVEYVEADRPNPKSVFSYSDDHDEDVSAVKNARDGLPTGLKIVSSEPITEKRSVFIGHAVRVTDEKEVPLVVNDLLEDRKIAKAAHPAIFAYRIAKDVGGVAGKVYNTDYDDDGESQAGARLKHLLEILELENVMVVVTRWYGGTLLGPDRFKHINQAARDALELAGFLDEDKKEGKKVKRK